MPASVAASAGTPSARPSLLDRIVCALPVVGGTAAIIEYLYMPSLPGSTLTWTYVWFMGALTCAALVGLVASLASERAYEPEGLRADPPRHDRVLAST